MGTLQRTMRLNDLEDLLAGVKPMDIEPVDPQLLADIDALEKAFDDCKHPYLVFSTNKFENMWCNVCGAQYSYGVWLKPHWRDIIVKVLFRSRTKG